MKALDEPAPALNVPFHVLFGEAIDVARFFAQHWKNVEEDETIVRYGLESVRDRLPASMGAEIMALVELAQDAQSRYRLATRGPRGGDPVGRATFLAAEIDAALAFLFDDGIEDDKDDKLAAIRAAHAETGLGADALAAELADYAALASEHRPALDGLGGFDAELIDEAKRSSDSSAPGRPLTRQRRPTRSTNATACSCSSSVASVSCAPPPASCSGAT